MLIGLCGKSGCGKSTLARAIAQASNGLHIDMDKIGHSVNMLPDVKDELRATFGDEIFTADGVVDRKKLAAIVFNSPKDMELLTDITWKHIERIADNILKDDKHSIIILDWLLLPKTKYFDMCDYTILLDVPYKVREQRAIARDGISADQFKTREKASINYNKADFDLVLSNESSIDSQQIMRTIQEAQHNE